MRLILATFCYCIASALIPVINAEAYVGGVAAVLGASSTWIVAATAAAGQMVGKLVYYLLGQNSLKWTWVRKKTESERWRASFDRWQRRIGGNPWMAALVLLVSASVGFPPFAIIAVLSGQLRVPLPLFVVVGFVGRLVRFASILGLVKWLV